MSDTRQKWEATYAQAASIGAPAELVVRFAPRLQGRVLDLACGSGRNGLFLASRGHAVDLIDIAHAPLAGAMRHARERAWRVQAVQANLENYPLPATVYDVVLNFRYLQRSLWSPLRTALRPGGILVFETFTIAQRELGHPRNPDFLLQPGELAARFSDWHTLHSFEGRSHDGKAHIAQLVAQRP